jgi:hypothetical protein
LLVAWAVGAWAWQSAGEPLGWLARVAGTLYAVALPIAFFFAVSSTGKDHFGTDSLNELAGNSLYEFARALRSNELDFMRLYATLPEREAFELVRETRFL